MIMQTPFYNQSAFYNDTTTFHTSRYHTEHGVEGELIPYSVSNDNFITSLLLICFVVFIVSIAHSHRFLKRQAKNFLFASFNEPFLSSETTSEVHFQAFLSVLAVLLSVTVGFQYTMVMVPDAYWIENELELLSMAFAILMAYHLFRIFLYTVVNRVFFTKRQNIVFLRSLLFIYAAQSILLFPAVLIVIYFNIPLSKSVYFFAILFISSKILSFYKTWSIFFQQNKLFLQIILYLCALEIVPLICLAGVYVALINNLKLIF